MTTRAGTLYKPLKKMGTEGSLKVLEKMMAQLLEDRRRREEEITSERERWEAEIAAERERREEDRQQREREVKLQMDAMQAHMERLMKVVEDSKTTPAAKSVGELSGAKLVPLSEKDDIEAYLVTFERIMEAHKVEKGRWAHYWAPQLTGRAQLAFAALPTTESGKYESIKAAILQQYDINEEAYRRRFRTAVRAAGETNREYAVKLMDLQKKWLKEYTTVEGILEAVGLEQFLNSLPMEKRVWVHERKPKTCVAAGELLDQYEQVRRQDPGVELQQKSAGAFSSGKGSSAEEESSSGTAERRMQQLRRSAGKGVRCFGCGQLGHVRKDCLDKRPAEKVMFSVDTKQPSCEEDKDLKVKRQGFVEGQKVQDILLDTGCTRTLVHADLVPSQKVLEGDVVTIKCAHGDTRTYPTAIVGIQVDGLEIEVEAAISEKLPVAVLLGKDVPEFSQLLGTDMASSGVGEQQEAMIVAKGIQACQKLEEQLAVELTMQNRDESLAEIRTAAEEIIAVLKRSVVTWRF